MQKLPNKAFAVPAAKLRTVLVMLLALLPVAAFADDKSADVFQARTFASPQGGSLPYGLFIPRKLDPGRKYPLVLFLHAYGERGTDNKRQLQYISDWMRPEIQKKYPCFIVAPQCPNWREVFQVYGANSDLAVASYRNYAGSEKQWKHYQIPVGKQYTGRMNWLFFFNDDWGKDTPVESQFRNVRVYELGQAAKYKTVDFRKVTLTPYAGGGRGNNPSIEDEGATLHILGDARKKIAFPYAVTRNTVLEFDFRSSHQGNIHGIGLDDNDQVFEYRWVQTDWGAASHVLPKEPSTPLRMVMELLPTLQKEYPSIDVRRIYVTGISMGGFGVWDLLARRPEWFAAAVPICGGADLETANAVAPVPIWDFHGADDGTVRPERSRNMIAALWDIGSEPRYTEYPRVGHDAWTAAFREPDLLPWLFAHKRPMGPPSAPTNLRAVVAAASHVKLSWSEANDADSGIKEYRILRDGGEIGFATEPRFTDTEVSEGEVHSYTVLAINRAWLKSTPTPQVWVKIPKDSLPPRVTSVQALGGPYRVEVIFDKVVDRKQAIDTDNYSLNRGVTVNRATLLADEKTVRLDTAPLIPQTEYILSISRISDRAAKPNTMAIEARMKFVYDPCLAGYWRFDEGQGNSSADATGNGNDTSGNAVAFQSVEWAPGKWGKSLSFDGIWNHIAWSRLSQSLDLTDGLTVSLWAKKSGGQYSHQILIAKSNYYDHRTQFMIDFDSSQRVRATVGTLDRGEVSVLGKRIDARDWHNITFSYGSNTLELYIDGVSQGKATGGDKLMSVSEPITFGGGHQGRDPFKGCLDEIRIYNRAISTTAVKALAAAGEP